MSHISWAWKSAQYSQIYIYQIQTGFGQHGTIWGPHRPLKSMTKTVCIWRFIWLPYHQKWSSSCSDISQKRFGPHEPLPSQWPSGVNYQASEHLGSKSFHMAFEWSKFSPAVSKIYIERVEIWNLVPLNLFILGPSVPGQGPIFFTLLNVVPMSIKKVSLESAVNQNRSLFRPISAFCSQKQYPHHGPCSSSNLYFGQAIQK